MTPTKLSVTRQVQTYVSKRPSLRACLAQGLINYSSVAREICRELRLQKFDAVVAALRRLSVRVRKEQGKHGREVLKVLRKAKVHIQGNMIVLVFMRPRDIDPIVALQKQVRKGRGDFTILDGEDALVVITNEVHEEECIAAFGSKVLKSSSSVAQIILICDERIETTPGVTAFVYGRLAEHGINILEERSCWTDLMFVVHQKDLARTLELLEFE